MIYCSKKLLLSRKMENNQQKIRSETLKEFALIQEVETAVFFIREGLVSLNGLDGANDFAHLPLFLLSNGFERLLKLIICLDYIQRKGKFPDASSFKKSRKNKKGIKTHDVDDLLKRVIDIAEEWKYAERCAATQEDITFLQNDDDLQKVVSLLAAYGINARYYNMNVIFGEKNSTDDPKQVFESYCTDIFTRQPNWQEKITGENLGEKIDANIRYVNRQITMLLQKFARALCRMFTLGKLGQLASQQTATIGYFLFLKDEDLYKVK